MKRRLFRNLSASICMALCLFAVSVEFCEGRISGNCTFTFNARNSPLNCSSVKKEFGNMIYNPGYWTLQVQVGKVTDGRDCSNASVVVAIEITRAYGLDIAKYKLKKELCDLNKSEAYVAEDSNIITHTLKRGGESRKFFIDDENEISFDAHQETLFIAATTAISRRTEVNVSGSDGLASYNTFRMAEKAKIMIVKAVNKNGTRVDAPVFITIATPKAPLSYLSDDVYLIKAKKLYAYHEKFDHWNASMCKTTGDRAECKHNSAFAIIFAVYSVAINPILKVVSTVLESISMALLLVAAVLLGIYRQRMRNFDRVLVQISLCFALLFTHLSLVISPSALHNGYACVAIAVLAHYFLVATTVLMVTEGALMLTVVLVPNFFSGSSNSKRRRIIGLLVAWILPLIYVGVCAAIGISSSGLKYARWNKEKGRHQECWISEDLIPIVIVPVALALAINSCIAIRLGVLVWRMSKNAEEFKPSNQRDTNQASHVGKAFRAIVILLPILGIPWIIGFMVTIEPLTFMTIHIIVNGLQGVLLFVHYVVINSEMRACLQRSWKMTMSSIGTLTTPSVQFTSDGNRSDSTVALRNN